MKKNQIYDLSGLPYYIHTVNINWILALMRLHNNAMSFNRVHDGLYLWTFIPTF